MKKEFNMNFKSKQQLFDYIYTFLYNQNKKSTNEHNACLYRGPDNTKCAIGCIIPDKTEIDYNYNSITLDEIIDKNMFMLPWYILRNKEFLLGIQHIHDSFQVQYTIFNFRQHLKNQFTIYGNTHNLNLNVIK
jgi:hypothetical protein